MKNFPKKNKTDYLIEGLTAKDVKNFDKYIKSRTGRTDFFELWSGSTCSGRINLTSGETSRRPSPSVNTNGLSRKFLSDFNKILESYYICASVDNDEQGKMIYLLREMRTRNMDKLFTDLLSQVKRYHKHKIRKGFVHNITLLRSYYEEYFLSHAMNDEDNMIKLSSQISELSQNILIQKILFENINRKLYSGMLLEKSGNALIGYDDALKFVESNIQYIRTKQENIYLLYLISKMIDSSGDEDEARKIIKYLKSRHQKFTADFVYHAYENILRYLISRINRGIAASLKLAFEMVQEIDSRGILKHVPHVQPLDFFAVVNIYVRMGRLDLGERFIENYSGKLIIDSRRDILNISTAIIEFAKGNYAVSKSLLVPVKTKSLPLYLFSKATLIKSMYEKNELIAISSVSDTVKHFLNRKKELTPYYRESIFRFFSFVNRLAYSKRNKGKGISKLRSDLNEGIPFYQKSWIDEKFAELVAVYPSK